MRNLAPVDTTDDVPTLTQTYRSIRFSFPGTAVVQTGVHRIYFPRAAVILFGHVSAGTAPTNNQIIVDLNKNGTTMYTTQGDRPQVGPFSNNGVATFPAITSVAAGDYLTVDIDQVGNTIAGADVIVRVEYRIA